MDLGKYSIGVGERLFGIECVAQLRAVQKALANGTRIIPVWNKSNREHMISGTVPEEIRKSAEDAVRNCGWQYPYFVDADHIGIATVDAFLASSDFFTIDVADYIGQPGESAARASFIKAMNRYKGTHPIPGLQEPLDISDGALEKFADDYFCAITEAGKVYRYIAEKKGSADYVTEISMDEAWTPQTAAEMFLILAGIAREDIPVQTIAPKFTGSFLKGIDYVGNPQQFIHEFNAYLAVIAFAVTNFGLPRNLKLSVHTGSDKFSLYPLICQSIKAMDAGVHLKTAGTTWLEEVVGMAASGGEGLKFAKEVYADSYLRYDELCKPYLAVIHIDKEKLPSPAQVSSWSSEEFVQALRHDQRCAGYNVNLRQLFHIGFRVAAEKKTRFVQLLRECRGPIEENVTANLYDRHIRPLFFGA